MAALEIYSDQATATVTSGGNDAPVAGTQEVWGVTSSAALPSASSSANPPTQFHIADTTTGYTGEIITVINVSGTALTVLRGAENTSPVIHLLPFSVQQVLTSGGVTQFPRVDWYNPVTLFGADNTGATGSAGSIQTAINAAQLTGTCVYLPAGTYLLDKPLTVTLPITLQGAGRDATVLKIANGVNDYAIKFTQGNGTAITGAWFSDFQVEGNASNQTGGGGINALGAVECNFERIHFTHCFNWGLQLGAIPGGAFGHNNRLYGCTFDNAAAFGIGGGLITTSNDENMITACDFQFLGGTAGPGGAGGTIPVALYDASGLNTIQSCVFVGSRGGNTNIYGVRVQNTKQTRIENCVFDGVGGDNVFLASTDCSVIGCEMTSIGDQGPANIGAAGVHTEFGALRCVIMGNNMMTSSTTGKTGYFIYEQQIGNSGLNTIVSNTLLSQVSGGSAIPPSQGVITTQGSASIVRGNIGYNPVGHLTSPAIPTSGAGTVNVYNVDASVWITGGTVSAIALNGTSTGQTTGLIPLPAAGTITLTYTGAPTWTWFGF